MLFGRNIVELNATNNAVVRSYVWGLDLSGTMDSAGGVGGLAWVTLHTASGPASGTHFVCYDGNGNIVALVSATTGDVTARYEYGPFGEPIRISGPGATLNPFRFSTQRTEPTTDLVLYEYRVYNSTLGRWPNRDPIGVIRFETLRRGRASLRGDGPNLYLFVGNAPVSLIDAFGLTRVESGTWFSGSISDGVFYWTDVDDGQSGTVTLRRITMAEVESEMKRLVGRLQGFEKADACKSRKYEGGFDRKYFEGDNQQHQYYLVDGKGLLYADNEINYIGIGQYEAWLCDSLSKAKAIVWVWKLGRWQDVPSEGTIHWLEVGYNYYKTIDGNNNTSEQDGICCRRCRGESDRR
jgi:RHS repeat-associated protein